MMPKLAREAPRRRLAAAPAAPACSSTGWPASPQHARPRPRCPRSRTRAPRQCVPCLRGGHVADRSEKATMTKRNAERSLMSALFRPFFGDRSLPRCSSAQRRTPRRRQPPVTAPPAAYRPCHHAAHPALLCAARCGVGHPPGEPPLPRRRSGRPCAQTTGSACAREPGRRV